MIDQTAYNEAHSVQRNHTPIQALTQMRQSLFFLATDDHSEQEQGETERDSHDDPRSQCLMHH